MSSGVSFYDGGQSFVSNKDYDTQPSASPSKGGPMETPLENNGHSFGTSNPGGAVPGAKVYGPLDV
jgi:hypothetical protein